MELRENMYQLLYFFVFLFDFYIYLIVCLICNNSFTFLYLQCLICVS